MPRVADPVGNRGHAPPARVRRDTPWPDVLLVNWTTHPLAAACALSLLIDHVEAEVAASDGLRVDGDVYFVTGATHTRCL
jgi:hypothetical protein